MSSRIYKDLDQRVYDTLQVLRKAGKSKTTVREIMRYTQLRRGEDSVAVLGAVLRCIS